MPTLMLSRLRSCLVDKGANPRHHEMIESQHRQEWPMLWAAIDELMRHDSDIPDRGPEYYDAFGKFQTGPRPPEQVNMQLGKFR